MEITLKLHESLNENADIQLLNLNVYNQIGKYFNDNGMKVSRDGNNLEIYLDIPKALHGSTLHDTSLADIQCIITDLVCDNYIDDEQVEATSIFLNFDIKTNHPPYEYINLLKENDLFCDDECEQLLFDDVYNEELEKDSNPNRPFTTMNVLRLSYFIIDLNEKFGYTITAEHLLRQTFWQGLVNIAVEKFTSSNFFEQLGDEPKGSLNHSLKQEIINKFNLKADEVRKRFMINNFQP